MSDSPFWYDTALQMPSNTAQVTVAGATIEYATWGDIGNPGIVLIHGSNAMMGSINVVTKSDSQELGSQVAIVTGVHAPQSMLNNIEKPRYLTDFSLFHKSDDIQQI